MDQNSLNFMIQGIICLPIQSMSPQFDSWGAVEDSVKNLA